MPIPSPSSGEERDDFIARCMHELKKTDPERPNEQRLAMCFTSWRDKHPSSPEPKDKQS